MVPEDVVVEDHNAMIIDAVHVPAVPPAPVVPPALVVPPAAAVAPPAPPVAHLVAPARAAAAAPAPSSLSLALVPMGLSPAKRNRSDGSSEDGNVVSTALVAVPSAASVLAQGASKNEEAVAARTRHASKKPRGRGQLKKAQDSLDDGTPQEQIDFAPRGGHDDDDDDAVDM
jgi:hypothetical protein